MSTVKLITPYNKTLHDALRGHKNIRVLVASGAGQPRVSMSAVRRAIFEPYSGKLVIFGEFARGDLPVPEYTYTSADRITAAIARGALADIIDGVLNNSSDRTYSMDNITYYDVYMVWNECRNLEVVSKYVLRLLMSVYGTTNVDDVAPWGGKTIGEMKAAEVKERDYQRILDANLQFPIILRYGGKMVDGHHRLVKSALTGRKYISAIVIPGDRLRKCKINVPVNEYYKQF
jgi:hypothetical protein